MKLHTTGKGREQVRRVKESAIRKLAGDKRRHEEQAIKKGKKLKVIEKVRL